MHGKTMPAAIAGGDYYDFIDLEGRFDIQNKMGIVIADASGHGLAAAMLIRDFNTALYMGISFQSYYEKATTSLTFHKDEPQDVPILSTQPVHLLFLWRIAKERDSALCQRGAPQSFPSPEGSADVAGCGGACARSLQGSSPGPRSG